MEPQEARLLFEELTHPAPFLLEYWRTYAHRLDLVVGMHRSDRRESQYLRPFSWCLSVGHR